MADMDEEFARFLGEVKDVEEAVAAAEAEQLQALPSAAQVEVLPPPVLPSPPAAAAGLSAAAPPPLLPPPVLQPPPLVPPILPPPAAAVPAAAAAAAAAAAYAPMPAAAAALGYGQQPYMDASGPGSAAYDPFAVQQPLQQPFGIPHQQPPPQQQQQQHNSYPQPPAVPAVTGNAPADAETLKKLKEELLQQKQQSQAAGGKGGSAAGGGSKSKQSMVVREAAGVKWVDKTLSDWPENDFRIFVGDLGNEVNDDSLSKAFSRYPSFAKARVIRDKRTNKSKGYGIVSLLDGNDFAKALKEMNGKYIGNRPCKLSRSTWKERSYEPQHKGKSGGGGGGGEKRRADGQQASHNKAQKTGPLGPKFKYHVPIFKQ